jgi:hypothetical protein
MGRVQRTGHVDPAIREPAGKQPVDIALVVNEQDAWARAYGRAVEHPAACDLPGHTGEELRQRRFQVVPEVRSLARIVCAKAFAPFQRVRISAARYDDHVDRWAVRPEQMRAGRQAVHFRHIDIDDDNIGFVLLRLEKRHNSIGRGIDVKAHARAVVRQEPHDRRIVIRDEHLWCVVNFNDLMLGLESPGFKYSVPHVVAPVPDCRLRADIVRHFGVNLGAGELMRC